MPELPEVDAAREAIHEHFAGKTILKAEAQEDDKVLEGVSAQELEQLLVGRKLLQPRRKGKHLWFEMDSPDKPMPIFHLGMAGAFEVRGATVAKYKRASKAPQDWPPKYCKVTMEFEGGGALAFVDSRRFGRIRAALNPESSPPISELGLDALYELPPPEQLAQLLGASHRAIKAVLLDQTVLCGIGNWLADEVLYQAQVHPESPASALTEADYERLHGSIQSVLSHSVSVRADSALFPETWLFHVRWDKKPGKIGGHSISFITVGGRTSAVVAAVQKLVRRGANAKALETGEVERVVGRGGGGRKAANGGEGGRVVAKARREKGGGRRATAGTKDMDVDQPSVVDKGEGKVEVDISADAMPARTRGKRKRGSTTVTVSVEAAAVTEHGRGKRTRKTKVVVEATKVGSEGQDAIVADAGEKPGAEAKGSGRKSAASARARAGRQRGHQADANKSVSKPKADVHQKGARKRMAQKS